MNHERFLNLYKYSGKNLESSQQKRRLEFLENQKNNRRNAVDSCRDLSALLDLEETEDMEQESQRECQSRPVYKKRKSYFNFTLMHSEYLTEVPDDLEKNWLVKFCPKGVRVLLVAKRFKTRLYTAEGYYVLTTKSNFPGGGYLCPNGITILDCIYNKEAKVIFVLDCLYWNNMSMIDTEVNFRFQWLKSKYDENPNMGANKNYKFPIVDFFPAERQIIEDAMSNVQNFNERNIHYYGVTFYHKESIYSFGYTPLVSWLWTYMLPEKLDIIVSKENLIHTPHNYVNVETYLENLARKQKKKNKVGKGATQEMDCN